MSFPFDDSEHLLLFIVISSIIVFIGIFPPWIPCCTKKMQHSLVTLVWSFLLGVLALALLAAYGVLPSDTFMRVLIVLATVVAVNAAVAAISKSVFAAITVVLLVLLMLLFKAYVNSFLVDSLGFPALPDYVYYMLMIVTFIVAGAVLAGMMHSDYITIPIMTFLAWLLLIVSIDILIIEFISPGTNQLQCASDFAGFQNTCPFTPDYLVYVLFIGWPILLLVRWRIQHTYHKRKLQTEKNKYIKEHMDLRHSNTTAPPPPTTPSSSVSMKGEPHETQSLLSSADDDDPLPSIHGSGMPILKRSSPFYVDAA